LDSDEFKEFILHLVAWGHASRGRVGPKDYIGSLGKMQGESRPSPIEWTEAIERVEQALVLLGFSEKRRLKCLRDYYFYTLPEQACAQNLKMGRDMYRLFRGECERAAFDLWVNIK
jgi:hypothetical protein